MENHPEVVAPAHRRIQGVDWKYFRCKLAVASSEFGRNVSVELNNHGVTSLKQFNPLPDVGY